MQVVLALAEVRKKLEQQRAMAPIRRRQRQRVELRPCWLEPACELRTPLPEPRSAETCTGAGETRPARRASRTVSAATESAEIPHGSGEGAKLEGGGR